MLKMSEPDPSVFLRSERSKTNDAPLFDAKKWLWVPDETAGFVAGQIKEQTGDTVILELTNGTVSVVATLPIGYSILSIFFRRSPWISMTHSK